MLPVPGRELPGVLAYRDIADTEAMIDAASRYRKAVVIGGGLLGLEAANGLMRRGMDVSVIHVAPWLMERQLDATAGALLQRSLEARGLRFLIGAHTEAILAGDDGRVRAVRLKDGPRDRGRAGVMAVGIRPNTDLAQRIGLHCDRGIVVGDTMQTLTDARIYAVGECASHPRRRLRPGRAAVRAGQGRGDAPRAVRDRPLHRLPHLDQAQGHRHRPVLGRQLRGGEGTEEIVMSDPFGGVYKKLVIRGDKLVGACLYGDTVDGSWYFKLLREGRDIADIRDRLMFGESNIGDVGHEGHDRAARMPDDAEVCGCNGVAKGAICKAIKDKGLFHDRGRAPAHQGERVVRLVHRLVEQILMFTAGGDYSATPKKKALCGCTDLGHEDVRQAIRMPLADGRRLLSLAAVRDALGWRTPDGCATCRPALNYYLLSTWPKEARDDPQSRFVNERSHANIQKDGTYSVVPRMWGGETTAAELRRIADTVDKYRSRRSR
jgi:nitrite reductase (NADH) large subunit